MTESARRAPLPRAVELYLLFLPLGHLLVFPLGGAMATATDAALAALVVGATGGLALGASVRARAFGSSRDRSFLWGVVALMGLALWVGLSGLWGFHARYALAKGVGLASLVAGAGVIALSGVGWRRAADAWLAGSAVALAVTAAFVVAGPEALRARVLYAGGGVLGLPFYRISGPLIHPNMLGDFLVLSGVLWWARWPEWTGRRRRWGAALGGGLAVGLLLTASTAWIAAGIVITAIALAGRGRRSVTRWALAVGGAGLALTTLLATVSSLDVALGPLHVTTNGIRPDIWVSAAGAVAESPLLGVGASPYLAEAPDPLSPGGEVHLWDAHNAYLSVSGQFGSVGLVLLLAGIGLILKAARCSPPGRERAAVLLGLLAVGVHAIFMASEDLRHVWAWIGLCGVVGRGEA